MANNKRKHLASSSTGNKPKKIRPNHHHTTKDASQGYMDYTTGMRGAIPGLSSFDDEDEAQPEDSQEDEITKTEREALKYLRSVRSEASSLPSVFALPPPRAFTRDGTAVDPIDLEVNDEDLYHDNENVDDNEEGYEDPLGYYSDGAYVAAPHTFLADHMAPDDEAKNGDNNLVLASSAYLTTLLKRYDKFRATLRRPALPQRPGLQTKQSKSPLNLPYIHTTRDPSSTELSHWSQIIKTSSPPLPYLRNLVSQERLVALRLATIFTTLLRRSLSPPGDADTEVVDVGRTKCVGMWIWGFLGVLPDPGTMGSEEVAVIRELGKRAAKVVGSLRAAMARSGAAGADGDIDVESGAEEMGDGDVGNVNLAIDKVDEAGEGQDMDLEDDEDAEPGYEVMEDLTPEELLQSSRRRNSSSSISASSAPHNPITANPSHHDNLAALEARKAALLSSLLTRDKLPEVSDLPPYSTDLAEVAQAVVPQPLPALTSTQHVPPTTEVEIEPAQPNGAAQTPIPQTLPPLINPQEAPQTTENKTDPTEEETNSAESAATSALTTLFTLDAILTVIGERYGQRDLLAARNTLWALSEPGRFSA